jgi:raffinose/stachyose/melibiose transport system permease protein
MMARAPRPTRIVFWVIIAVVIVVQVFPIAWLMVSSFRHNLELSTDPFGLPKSFTLDNYVTVFARSSTLLYMRNSGIIAAVSLVLIVITASLASFAISKLRFRFRNQIFSYFLMGLTVPVVVTLIPLFTNYVRFGILDTYLSMILPMTAFSLPVSVLLFVNFFKFVPDEIVEAAVLDGYSAYGIFGRIVFPLSTNTVVTVVAMNAIFIWNDFVFSLTFINKTARKTISLGLQDFIGSHGLTDWGATFAAICISTLPTLILYFALNRKVVGGMTLGAVKD